MDVMNAPPNDVRNLVHKRLFRAAKGFITGGPGGALGGFFEQQRAVSKTRRVSQAQLIRERAPTRPVSRAAVRRPVARTLTARPGATSAAQKRMGLEVKFANVSQFSLPEVFGRCIPPFFSDGQGGCELDIVPGPGGGGTGAMRDIGETVMGRYGAGEVPGNQPIDRAVCRRGMILGDDGVCYNKSQITNKERQWPRGRRPLLTGGDMRAISTAARAGRRLTGATKRLQKIGLMKKPAPRRISQAQAHHQLKP